MRTMNALRYQMNQATKDAVRVKGHGQAHAMTITQSLTRPVDHNTQRTQGEKEKKAKEQRLKEQGEEEAKEQ